MLGRIFGAVAGDVVARTLGGARAGPLGAVAGLVLPAVLRRLGPLGMIGAAAGAYAVKKYLDGQEDPGGERAVPPAIPPL